MIENYSVSKRFYNEIIGFKNKQSLYTFLSNKYRQVIIKILEPKILNRKVDVLFNKIKKIRRKPIQFNFI